MCLRHFFRAAPPRTVPCHSGLMAGAAPNRDWLVGRRFFDEGEEYEVMRVGRKRWKKSDIDVAFYCVPDQRADEPEWEWSKAEEVEEFVKKNPALDDGFHTTLLERADELETHPLAQEDVDTIDPRGLRSPACSREEAAVGGGSTSVIRRFICCY